MDARELSSFSFWIISLLSPAGFAYAMDKTLVEDVNGNGVSFEDLWTDGDGSTMSVIGSTILLIMDMLIYACLALYFDAVIPSKYRPTISPLFCFFNCFRIRKVNATVKVQATANDTTTDGIPMDDFSMSSSASDADDIEPVSKDMLDKEAIHIVDLFKVYSDCVTPPIDAINGINLKIYEGQITAILGHNGAGKSTLFNILTGLTTATSGTAYIYGKDVR